MRMKILLLVLVSFLFYSGVYAFQTGMCAEAHVTSINPSSIGPDEDFTVGILIDNCGQEIPENLIFEITRHSQDISVKEPLIQEIGRMGYANSKRFIVFNMRSSQDITPGEHLFETKLTYGKNNFFIEKRDNFTITAIHQKPDLAISRIYTNPEIIYLRDKIILTIDVENAGNGKAKDVRVEIKDFDLEGIKLKYLGKIEYGENIPARFIFKAEKEGIQRGNIALSYNFAGETENLTFPLEIQVFRKGLNKIWIVLGIIILGVLGYLGYQRKTKS
jgi:hypothetical protein